jgi:hypothetical protein
MTKRAFQKFPRAADDFYPTPAEAVKPLLFHLRGAANCKFAEPCYGDGSLAANLEANGLQCVNYGDINGRLKLDARHWQESDYGEAAIVITNPPWEAKLMMEIMEHQSRFRPSWFLIYSDWLFTKQSETLMALRCTDIVPIGRLKWIKDSKSVGFDNCCWVRMWDGKGLNQITARFWPVK